MAIPISPASAAEGLVSVKNLRGQNVEAIPGQVIVKYKKNHEGQVHSRIQGRVGAVKVGRRIGALSADVLAVPAGQTIESFMALLSNDPDVEYVEPNGVYRAFTNDPGFANQYYLGSGYIDIDPAWAITTGDTSVVVAVLDTGVNLTHPDLVNKLWSGGVGGTHGKTIEISWDGDLNCTEDFGGDFGHEQCENLVPEDNNAENNTYHGTRCAGIIAAETNNTNGVAGVCQNCEIMAVKVLNQEGTGSFDAIAEGIVWAVDNGADVLNLSLGGPSSHPLVTDAVAYAHARNVIVVAASGNLKFGQTSCTVNYPAAIGRVIAVGSSRQTPAGSVSSFSCTGNAIDLVAPGENITTTVPTTVDLSGYTGGANGTSFATPMVSGVAALIRSLHPTMAVDDVTRYINFLATDMGAIGFDSSTGFGRLNAGATVAAANSLTPFISNPVDPGETFPYPNPYNPATGRNVVFSLPANLGGNDIEIKIYNVAGEVIKTLTGTNQWNGRNDDGNTIASGLYVYHAKTSAGDIKGKLTVIK